VNYCIGYLKLGNKNDDAVFALTDDYGSGEGLAGIHNFDNCPFDILLFYQVLSRLVPKTSNLHKA
jgi:hypothetical protein